MGLVQRSDSSAVGVLPSQEVLLLQEKFPTWTSESIVAMTTVCHNHCMHLIAVNQLVYIHYIFALTFHITTFVAATALGMNLL